MATIHGTGVLVSRRAVFWGTGYVIAKSGLRVATTPAKPLDEAKSFRFPMNVPGSTWAGP